MPFEIVPLFFLFIRVTFSQNLFLQAENGRSDVFNVDECGNSFSCIKFPNCEIEENRCAVAAWVSLQSLPKVFANLTRGSDRDFGKFLCGHIFVT